MNSMKFKIDSPEQSVALQKALFDAGHNWAYDCYKSIPQFLDRDTLYTDGWNIYTYVSEEDSPAYTLMDTDKFIDGYCVAVPVCREISVEEAMNIMEAAGGTRVENRVDIGDDVIKTALGVNAPDILQEAADALNNRATERDHEEGGERSMERCVASFNAMRGYDLSVEDGWLFMVFLKLARSSNGAFRKDDYVDMAAYCALAGEEASV